MDRLTQPGLWPGGDAAQRAASCAILLAAALLCHEALELEQTYEPFSPDSDLLKTRTFSAEERAVMQKRLVEAMAELLEQANFTRVDPSNVHFILTKDSAYGLDLQVDLDVFEEVLLFYRGADHDHERRRESGSPT